ncbi:MAG: hypothetical protein P8X95_01810 [Anaerolineales bacterium]
MGKVDTILGEQAVQKGRPAARIANDEDRLRKVVMLVVPEEEIVDGEADQLQQLEQPQDREKNQKNSESPGCQVRMCVGIIGKGGANLLEEQLEIEIHVLILISCFESTRYTTNVSQFPLSTIIDPLTFVRQHAKIGFIRRNQVSPSETIHKVLI